MKYTEERLRMEINRIIKSHTLCSDGEALGASGNIIEIHLISALPAMYEALKAGVEGIRLNPKGQERALAISSFLFLADKALAKAEGN